MEPLSPLEIIRNLISPDGLVRDNGSALPKGFLELDVAREFLHVNLVRNSDKQKSSQGNVYFVKLKPEVQGDLEEIDFVLKVYSTRNKYSFDKEVNVLEALRKLELQNGRENEGFPRIISIIVGKNQLEIVMKALGPSLKTLMS